MIQRWPASLHAESLLAVNTVIDNYKAFLQDSADPNERRMTEWLSGIAELSSESLPGFKPQDVNEGKMG